MSKRNLLLLFLLLCPFAGARSADDAPWVPMLDDKIASGERMKAVMESGAAPSG